MRTRVLFLTPFFGDGGGERTWVNILQRLDRDRFEPSLAWFEHVESHFLAEIPRDVAVHDLGKRHRLSRDLPRMVRNLRRLLRDERPDVVVSLLHTWGFVLEASRVGLPTAVIANEHIHVDSSLRYLEGQRRLLGRVAPLLHRITYARAERVVGVSEIQVHDLQQRFRVPAGKTAVIPVGVDRDELRRRATEPLADPWYEHYPLVVAIGRLIPQKAFKDLLSAFAEVARQTPARLVILGEGELRPQLEQQVRDLGLEDRVRLPGLQANPYSYLGRARVFALSSHWEAMPQVVIEALALGVPVVATDCPTGPRELLDGGRFGQLVDPGDIPAIAEAITRVVLDEAQHARLGRLAAERGAAYDVTQMVRRYEAEIARAASS
jgi:glycosyltransferase involved in cell wall biosynthesis